MSFSLSNFSVKIFTICAAFMIIAIGLGAFGAHALKAMLNDYALSIFQTATNYLTTQTLGLMLVGFLSSFAVLNQKLIRLSAVLLVLGIVIFSGSLYVLAITGIKWLGAITPIGGTALIIAWCLLFFTLVSGKKSHHGG